MLRSRKVNVSVLAGEFHTREKGPARKVMLNGPWGLFLGEHSSVLYIADIFNHRIRALRLEGS